MLRAAFLSMVVATAACGAADPGPAAPPPPAPDPPRPAEPAGPQRIDLLLDEADGLSGLTTDGSGVHWAVPESTRALVRLRPDRFDALIRVSGAPEEIDLEAMTWIGGSRFAVGTESTVVPRPADLILVIEVDGEAASVVDTIEVPYDALPISGEENRGIEGLCFVDGHYYAAFEQPLVEGEARIAIVADRAPDGTIRALRLPLTTETGKISGLDCRRRGGAVEVVAIERHYAIHRILRFTVPDGDATELVPEVLVDLAGTLIGDPNLEGIAWTDRGLLLVVDNQYGERTGPNEIITVELVP